jgi:hypothetical protein
MHAPRRAPSTGGLTGGASAPPGRRRLLHGGSLGPSRRARMLAQGEGDVPDFNNEDHIVPSLSTFSCKGSFTTNEQCKNGTVPAINSNQLKQVGSPLPAKLRAGGEPWRGTTPR